MKQVIARKSKIYYLYIGLSIFFVLFGIFLIYMTFLIGKIGRTELQDIFLTISLSVTTFGAAFIFIFLSLRIARIPEELIVLEGNILYCYYDKAMVPIPLAEIFSANYQLYPRSCHAVINIQCKSGRILAINWIAYSQAQEAIQRMNIILQQYWYSCQQAAQTARPSNS